MTDKVFLATKLLVIKQQIEQWQQTQKEIEDELIEILEEDKTVEIGNAKLTRIESNRAYYDITKMQNIFDKALLNKLCDKEISVDKAELRDLFERKPELKKILSSALKVSYEPNVTRIKKALDDGDLSNKQLRQFASVKTTVYIKTTKKELQEDE